MSRALSCHTSPESRLWDDEKRDPRRRLDGRYRTTTSRSASCPTSSESRLRDDEKRDRRVVACGVGADMLLDDVSVEAVPEPSTIVLSTLGFLLLGLVRWRRRKAK